MEFEPPLQPATLVKRYKRFLADITLPDGTQTTIHCPNTGAMTGCAEPGWRIWYSDSGNPKRKYPCTWEMVENDKGHRILVNTQRANAIGEAGIRAGLLPSLAGYPEIKREVRYGEENSRIDLLLTGSELPDCYVEIKNVTLLAPEGDSQGQGFFPDAVTQRGQKHLRELMAMVRRGKRAVILFVVPHEGIEQVAPACHIDLAYADLCREASHLGVEFLALKCKLDSRSIAVNEVIPVRL